MTNAYCDLEDVKSSMSGDVPNVGTSHDASLVKKILEVSRDVDRKVSECRRESEELFSFLAEQQYGCQKIYLSSTPPATSGTFVLAFEGQVTSAIQVDADGAVVQAALEALSNVGVGDVLVSGFSRGPWTLDFGGALTGPRATITGAASTGNASASIVVLPMIQGVETMHSERRFTSVPPLYGRLLPIDDCVEIVEVRAYDASGAFSGILVEGVDYQRYPLRGLPVEALKTTSDDWLEFPNTYGVSSRWGFRTSIPEDVREAVAIEVVRLHLGAQAGNDDRIGMTPFGSVVTAKAFTSKFKELVSDYGRKLW